ncbi:MAG: hypothetical protein QOH32_3153 [Bradyrhizobium sp.]|jgi:hypothetical protein|nr:hypothetical protein [Bradyrhizobium sp.]
MRLKSQKASFGAFFLLFLPLICITGCSDLLVYAVPEISYKKLALEILLELSAIREEPKFAYLCSQLRSQLIGEDQQPKQQQQQLERQYSRYSNPNRYQQMVAENGPQQQQQQQQQQQPYQQIQQQQQQTYVTAEEFFAAASDVVKRRAPAYQTQAFKCMGDYEKCKAKSDYSACLVILVICVGRQLLPFVK